MRNNKVRASTPCLGDLVGYGGDPAPVMDRIMQMARDGAVVLQGNHDEMALSPPAQSDRLGEASAGWTHTQLNAEHREFLAVASANGPHPVVFSGPRQRRRTQRNGATLKTNAAHWSSLEAATSESGVRYVFGGHVHQQTLYYKGSGRGPHGLSSPPRVCLFPRQATGNGLPQWVRSVSRGTASRWPCTRCLIWRRAG